MQQIDLSPGFAIRLEDDGSLRFVETTTTMVSTTELCPEHVTLLRYLLCPDVATLLRYRSDLATIARGDVSGIAAANIARRALGWDKEPTPGLRRFGERRYDDAEAV